MLASEVIYISLKDLFNGQVWPDPKPESQKSVLPYMTYLKVSGVAENTIEGYTGHDLVRMQLNIYTSSALVGEKLASQVKYIMSEQHLAACEYLGDHSDYDEPTNLHYQQLDFYIFQCL